MTTSDLLRSITLLISSKTGIKTRSQDEANLRQKIDKRIKALGLKNENDYLTLLKNSSSESSTEWDKLITLITTGESYFFRDRGQINLLKAHLLPNLIQRNQTNKTLNILSAGCSSGEEIYSLAILIGEILSNLDAWNISLVGIDLNKEAIVKAKRGLFPEWSFRGVEPHYRSVYFRQKPQGWEVIESIKKRTRFYQCNLVEDAIPGCPIGSVDLIICRNVFIYFDSEKVALVLSKFVDLLRPGGYLLTGHTELQGQEIAPLMAMSYPESVVYQMPLEGSENLVPEITYPTTTNPDFKELGKQAFQAGKYNETIGYLQNWLNFHPQDQEALLLIAQAYANQGKYEETTTQCIKILEVDPICLQALQLLAHINEEQGMKEEAKEYLRRMIFINPDYIPPYLDLIDLHMCDREYKIVELLLSNLTTRESKYLAEYQYKISLIKSAIHTSKIEFFDVKELTEL